MKIALCVAAVAGVACAWAFAAYDPRQCLTGHMENRHQDAWTQFVMIGKVMTPIFHQARDYQQFVCDEYQPE